MNIFEILNDRYTLPKRPKLFEAFSGLGCQRLAFKKLGIEVESVGISEIDKYAIKTYMAIHGETKNFGSICDIRGSDLPEIDIFTYSFPCTDLSKAGKQKGLNQTRSGLVYEVLRILHELEELDRLPKVLIMENVVDLVQSKFIRQFNEIQLELERIGYKNYAETLNAKDYGVAQNRDRIFMVSILGNHYYGFPKQIRLEKKLKDYLESDVDEKYYLSHAMLNYCTDMKDRNGFVRGERFNPQDREASYAYAITTNPGSRPVDNYIKEPICLNPKVDGKQPSVQDRVYDSDGISTCVTTAFMPFVTVPEATEKGYAEAVDGDSVNLAQPNSKTRRGRVGKQMSQTLTTQSQIGVVIYDDYNQSIRADQSTIGTLTTNCGNDASRNGYKLIENGLRIRKLTPRECWRLMGIEDEDFAKASSVNSNAQLYKQAGNGIVVDVFAKIISTMVE